MSKETFCEQCGVLIQCQKAKPRRFCSDRCRNLWWKAHPELMQKKAYYKAVCKYCGKEFEAYGTQSRTYCSKDCYFNARFGTKEERAGRAAAKQRELQERAQLPDHCLACPYYLQAQADPQK